uniref:Lens intrinsic membrane protein 2.3 n=1 Tax=Poecilia mexicana TaxID=48701 RepID=A0A3B3YVX2_9TELE
MTLQEFCVEHVYKGPRTRNSVRFLQKHLSHPTAYWDATRAFMILSLLACFIGIVIGIMAFIHYSSFDGFDKTFAAGILFFISCFFVLLAMAVYTGVTVNYYGKRYGSWRFSWSYIMGWVAVVLTFFSGANLNIFVHKQTNNVKYNFLPFSG